MKKFLKFVFAIMFMLLSMVGLTNGITAKAYATELAGQDAIRTTAYEYLLNFVQYNGVARSYVDRRAGTLAEKLSANFIASYLEGLGLEAKTHAEEQSIDPSLPGIQEFSFYDIYTGNKKTSYNVIYTIKGISNQKKVVISANYDNYYAGYIDQEDQVIQAGEDFSDGINASAASVAVLLTLAEILPQSYFDFDIELVFFGAGYNNNAGAKFYNQTMNRTERERVMLMLDISRIALGDNVYYYSGAFKTAQDNFYSNTLSLTKFKHGLTGSAVENTENLLGYSNAGYSSSTAVFEGHGLNVLHIFAGSYENGIFSGYCEYNGVSNITNSQSDSVDYILETYGNDLTDNMTIAVQNVISLLTNSNFVKELNTKPTTWQYKLFSANNYVPLILLVILIVLMIVCLLIHYGISKKTYKYIAENNINGVVIQIDEDKLNNSKDKKNE